MGKFLALKSNFKKGAKMTLQKEYFRRQEVAQILNISYKTLMNWVAQGYIKEYRINQNSRTPLIKLKEVYEMLEKAK